jgi:ribosome-associated protein
MDKLKLSTDQLITEIIKGIENNKGLDIALLDLREIENTVCDYFIIASGTSNTHVSSIAGSVEKEVSKILHEKPWHTEGEQSADWILLDYVNVVVHIFQKPIREHYDIEGLWGDATITNF